MRNTAGLVIKYLLYGISIGCTFFVIMCLSYSVLGGDDVLEEVLRDFTRQALGAMIIGVACGSTSIVYRFERLSLLCKTAIHFCVGMGVFYPAAISLGWIPFFPDRVLLTVLQFLFSCVIFIGIWFCFYLANRSEAIRINRRLRELEKDKPMQ